jgi:hypothetical protein
MKYRIIKISESQFIPQVLIGVEWKQIVVSNLTNEILINVTESNLQFCKQEFDNIEIARKVILNFNKNIDKKTYGEIVEIIKL